MKTILLIGDSCTDEYQYGVIERLSPEAPVPVFKKVAKYFVEGMAGNVKNNLHALGCYVSFRTNEVKSIKTRLIDKRSGQHIVRIDEDVISEPIQYEFLNFDGVDAVIISDYDKGFVTYDLVERIINEFKGPVFIDTKKTDLRRFQGAIVKINAQEYHNAKSACTNMIVTMGDGGAKLITGSTITTYEAEKVDVVDVCGAGDTFMAALVFRYLDNFSFDEAIVFANKAAAVTVQKVGVYAPEIYEIEESK